MLFLYLLLYPSVLHTGGPSGSQTTCCSPRVSISMNIMCLVNWASQAHLVPDLNDLMERDLCSANVLISLHLLCIFILLFFHLFSEQTSFCKEWVKKSYPQLSQQLGEQSTQKDTFVAISVLAKQWRLGDKIRAHKNLNTFLLNFLCLPGWFVVQELDAPRDQYYFCKWNNLQRNYLWGLFKMQIFVAPYKACSDGITRNGAQIFSLFNFFLLFKKSTLLNYNLHAVICTHSEWTVQWILTNIYSHVKISITSNNNLMPFCSPLLYPQLQSTADLLSIEIN